MQRNVRAWKYQAGAALLVAAMIAGAQEGGEGSTRLLLTQVRVKPAMLDTWLGSSRACSGVCRP